MAKTADTLRTEIEKSEQELNQLIERFDTFNFDIEDKGDIIKNVLLFTRRLTRIIGQHKASLTANKMFSFESPFYFLFLNIFFLLLLFRACSQKRLPVQNKQLTH